MFTHMTPITKETHQARGSAFELFVFRVEETGDVRIFIAKDGFGAGDTFTASREVQDDAASGQTILKDAVAGLIAIAKADIDRNEFGQY